MTKNILEMKNISKSFFGVNVLNNVDLNVKKGEIHAIVGENGAGKSTLVNIISGVYTYGMYSGDIIYNGEECKFSSIRDSESKGIAIIHQELTLIPYMSIAENMFIGNEQSKKGIIDWHLTNIEARKYLNLVTLADDPTALIKDIGIGKQQLVEIAKALAKKVNLLILDEPTAALNEKDSMHLLNLLLKFKKEGLTSIIISHRLNEVCYVADSITILRDGSTIETLYKGPEKYSEDRIIQGMVGRKLTNRYPKRNKNIGKVVFEVKNWNVYHPIQADRKVINNISINLRKGEIVGIYGLMGAGRTEFAMSLFGKSYGRNISGEIIKDGKELKINSAREAIDNGIAYIPEDRKENGLILINNIKDNISLAGIKKISRHSVVDNHKDLNVAEEHSKKLSIRSSGVFQKVVTLSGGNQQKVVLAKWIFTQPNILILDEPTRGVDVGAKYEIYKIINEMVKKSSAILISSELSEILGMCDRIYIMKDGEIVGEMDRAEATQEKIMHCIVKKDDTKENIVNE